MTYMITPSSFAQQSHITIRSSICQVMKLYLVIILLFLCLPANAIYFPGLSISIDRETTIAELEKAHFNKLPVQLTDGTNGVYETECVTKLFGKFQGEWFYLTFFHCDNPNIITAAWLEKDSFDGWESLLELRAKISDLIEEELTSPSFFCNIMDMNEAQKEVMDTRFGDDKYPTIYSLWVFKDLRMEIIADVDNLTLKLECLYK